MPGRGKYAVYRILFCPASDHDVRTIFAPEDKVGETRGHFPDPCRLSDSDTEDLFLQNLYRPIFLGVEWLALKLRFFQAGRVQLYILYIALTLFVLLIWNLR